MMTVMTAQLPLPVALVAGAGSIGEAVALVEDGDGGRVFLRGELVYAWSVGDVALRRLAAVQVVAIKALCRRANVEKLEAGPKGVVLSFRDNIFANPEGLIAFIREQGSGVRMRPDPKDAKGQQLVFFDDWERPDDRLKGTAAILRKLASIAEQAKAA